jgi:hypothetical protein
MACSAELCMSLDLEYCAKEMMGESCKNQLSNAKP